MTDLNAPLLTECIYADAGAWSSYCRVKKGAERFGQKPKIVLKEETVIVMEQVKKKAFGALFFSEGSKLFFGDMMKTKADKTCSLQVTVVSFPLPFQERESQQQRSGNSTADGNTTVHGA
jgi:hypothetical protein